MKIVFFMSVLWLCTSELVFAQGDALDDKVTAIFQAKCVMCHDDLGGQAGGEVGFLLDFVELAKPENGYLDADDPTDSYLRTMIDDGSMPKRRFKDIDWAGALSRQEKQTVFDWIDRGGPSDRYREALKQQVRAVISEQQVLQFIANDLQKLTGQSLKYARYLTLTNLHNNPDVKADELELYRQGMVKMLNSLSRSSDVLGLDGSEAVNKVVPVDGESRTVFRFDLRDIGWELHDWEKVAGHYPYALNFRSGLGRTVYSATGSTTLPYLRADWFVFATSQPPLYHDLVGIPDTLQKLEGKLGVNRVANIRNRKVARAGFGRSGVSANNRMIERHSLTQGSGAYHISYDFASNTGKQNFFENPLGPIEAGLSDKFAFAHDGGEVIYNLPNGFQAYALVTAAGKRLNVAPSEIVHDDSMPGGLIINGMSCMSCHYKGMKPENPADVARLDRVRSLALDNFRRFTEAERELIGELYVEHSEMKRLLDSDSRRFQNAMKQAGIIVSADEPVRLLFDAFVKPLTLNSVAGSLGIAADELEKKLQREGETRQLLRRLTEEREGLKRQHYLDEFQRLVRLTGLGEARKFEPLKFPYFGEDPDSRGVIPGPQAVLPEKKKFQVDLLDAENRDGERQVSVQAANGKKHFTDGELMQCVVKSNRDGYLTLLAIDPVGDVTVLTPNAWHPQMKLKAGRTVVVPTKEMGFEIFAQPPHGKTTLRAIVTTRPLKLKGVNRKSLKEQGVVTYKALGIRQKPEVNEPPSKEKLQLTDQDLDKMFQPGEWATSQWTLITHPKK